LQVSDGELFGIGIFPEGFNFEKENIKTNTVIHLKRCFYQKINGKNFLVLDKPASVMQKDDRIGNPVDWNTLGSKEDMQQKQTSISAFETPITPIKGLSPFKNNWVIQCRVVDKGSIKTWDKGPKNRGKLFSCILMDANDDEIKATFFNNASDKFYQKIEFGKIYNFSGGNTKYASKKYATVSCEYEINFDKGAIADFVVNPQKNINERSFKLIQIADVDYEKHTRVDICGVVISHESEVETFSSKVGREVTKFDFVMGDMSNNTIEVAAFGEKADQVKNQIAMANEEHVVIALKGAKVSDYNTCSLAIDLGTIVYINPQIVEAERLKTWSTNITGLDMNAKSKSKVTKIYERGTCNGLFKWERAIETEEIIVVKAALLGLNRNKLTYASVPEKGNQRKVKEQIDGLFYCEATQKIYNKAFHRYICDLELADYSGSFWVTAFNESMEKIFSESANDFVEKNKERDELSIVLDRVRFKEFLFRIRVKTEMYQNMLRKRAVVVGLSEVIPDKEIELIKQHFEEEE